MGRARHPQRHVFRLGIFGTTALLGVLAVSSTAAGALTAPAAKSVPAERWTRTICRSIGDWMDETTGVDDRVESLIEEVGDGDRPAKAAKARMLVSLKRAVRAGEELADDAKDAGTPKVEDGASYARSLRETLEEITDIYTDTLAAFKKLETSPSKRFANRAEELYFTSYDDFFEIGDPLEVLEDSPELAAAIAATDFCSYVSQMYELPTVVGAAVGDCLDEELLPIDCSEPHFDEVILVGDFPAAPDAPYPANRDVQRWVEENCMPAFAAYVGTSLGSSDYDLAWYSPTADTWESGDRAIVCTATSLDGEELTGSVQGGAQTL